VSQVFPDISIQSVMGSWWEPAPAGGIVKGSLVKPIVPYPDYKPLRMVPEGRGDDPRQHQSARYRLELFQTGQPMTGISALPVAGTPLRAGETYIVRRGKVRPAVVLAIEGTPVSRELRRDQNSWQYKPALLMAPYYGVESDGRRAGWPAEFVHRIQRAEYCQYAWDVLPLPGNEAGSILRLDHLFPVAPDPANWQPTGFKLREEALSLLDEWVSWHVTGSLPESTTLGYLRVELARMATLAGES
jgi:hypothetical protein